MGRPRRHPKAHVPSPLSQIHNTRPLSVLPPVESKEPEMGMDPDPVFWKRFSTAVHRSEKEYTLEMGSRSPASSFNKDGDQWLGQQHKEKRRCRVMCMSITLFIMILIVGGAVAAWYFTQGPGQT